MAEENTIDYYNMATFKALKSFIALIHGAFSSHSSLGSECFLVKGIYFYIKCELQNVFVNIG
jgi:hypothetical protein